MSHLSSSLSSFKLKTLSVIFEIVCRTVIRNIFWMLTNSIWHRIPTFYSNWHIITWLETGGRPLLQMLLLAIRQPLTHFIGHHMRGASRVNGPSCTIVINEFYWVFLRWISSCNKVVSKHIRLKQITDVNDAKEYSNKNILICTQVHSSVVNSHLSIYKFACPAPLKLIRNKGRRKIGLLLINDYADE